MDRVLWPMEPVEPRIASFFNGLLFSTGFHPMSQNRDMGHPELVERLKPLMDKLSVP